tara:strand:- start:12 stop:371 length:360 start_codon:yes stop_codon:yes gene_type:complete
MGKVKSWMMDMEEKVDDALCYAGLSNECDILDYVKSHMDYIIDKTFVLQYARERLGNNTLTSAVDNWKNSYAELQKIKDDQQDCTVCGCPITQKDYDDYKMCPWCYSRSSFDSDGVEIF